MFARLFGETKEIQFEFLKKNLIISVICVAVGSLLLLVNFQPGIIIAVGIPAYFIWAKRLMASLLGVATFGAIFLGSRNPAWIAFIFFAYIMLGYIAAIICFTLGLCRFVYLLTDRAKQNRTENIED